jgi:hypothetical protein
VCDEIPMKNIIILLFFCTRNAQIAKLKSFFQYFEWLEKEDTLTGSVRISRKVRSGAFS